MGEKAGIWTRFTDRLNVLVWALPMSRRVKAVLSRLVYQNPSMPAAMALLVLGTLEADGMAVVVMGGWGIDALVGIQQRAHRDLDLIVDQGDLERTLATLRGLGFREWFRNPTPLPFGEHGIEGDVVVMRNEALQVVDLHPMRLETLAPGIAVGSLAGREVSCVSASLQVKAHTGNRIRSRREKRRHQANLETARRALEATNRTDRRGSDRGRALA